LFPYHSTVPDVLDAMNQLITTLEYVTMKYGVPLYLLPMIKYISYNQ